MLYGLDRLDGLSSEVAQVHLISQLAPWIWMMTCIFLPVITTNRGTSQQANPTYMCIPKLLLPFSEYMHTYVPFRYLHQCQRQ